MNFIDHIVAVISPEAAYKRESYRQAYEALRQYYDAGDYSRTNANWRVMNASAENTDRYSRDNVRARSRDLERNSDIMNAVIGAYKRNVVGGGYQIQVKSRWKRISGKAQGTGWSHEIEGKRFRPEAFLRKITLIEGLGEEDGD